MTTNITLRFLSSVVGECRSRWSTGELIFVFFKATQTCKQSDVKSMIHAVGRCRVLRKNPSKKQNYFNSCHFHRQFEAFDSRPKPWCRSQRRAIDVRSLLRVLRPAHASSLPSRRSLRPPRSCFDPNFSPKIFDKVPLCSTRGSCFQRKSSLSRQNSRSFQGYSWFLQFSRPFQDLENGLRNSSTFQSFQGPYAPCLIFCLFESSWKKMKNDTTFVRMRSGDHFGDAKISKKGSVEFNFFNNCDRHKRFSQNERRRDDLQNVASHFLIFA